MEEQRTQRHIEWQGKVNGGGTWTETLQALGRLTPELRMAVVMKHYYGFSIKEIAEMTGVPEGTVKSRIYNGIQMLRKELKDDER
jgi:RNA polymerase sigma-70 factor (ECF subfamily)